MYNFHIQHHLLKIKPEGWEPPLPIELEIREKYITERQSIVYPKNECNLTPK
jgi:hypothetical protein